jgi:hypothetical protein
MSSETDTNEPLRRYAFYAAVVVFIAASVIILGQFLPHVVTGWTGSFGSNSIYALVIVAGMWTGLLGMAVQFYRPTERVNAILLMPFALLWSAAIGLATGTVFAVVTLILAAISLVPLVLHPAGRSVLRFDRVVSPNRLLVGLYAVGAIFLIGYGGQELVKQFTLTGEDALRGHYGDLAGSAFSMAVWGGLAVFRRRDWRFAAWITGFVAVYLGVSSVMFPDASSSLGLVGGVFVAIWAITFVAMTERVRGGLLTESGAIEESAVR